MPKKLKSNPVAQSIKSTTAPRITRKIRVGLATNNDQNKEEDNMDCIPNDIETTAENKEEPTLTFGQFTRIHDDDRFHIIPNAWNKFWFESMEGILYEKRQLKTGYTQPVTDEHGRLVACYDFTKTEVYYIRKPLRRGQKKPFRWLRRISMVAFLLAVIAGGLWLLCSVNPELKSLLENLIHEGLINCSNQLLDILKK